MRLGWRLAALKNGLQDATAYRVEFFMGLAGSMVVPALIQWILWYALFKIGGHETVAGMTYQDMIAYTFTSLLFTQVRGGDHDFELAEMIREGSLSNYLLRPVGVVEFVYIRGVAEKLFVSGIALAVGVVASFFVGLDPMRIVGAMLLALMGNVLHYQFGASLATASFYWEESYAVLMVKNMIVQILSGELIPLNMFPESWQWLWKSTPFYLYVYGPTQFALGRWSVEEWLQGMGIAVAWLIGFTLLIKLTWRIGIKRYSSLGG